MGKKKYWPLRHGDVDDAWVIYIICIGIIDFFFRVFLPYEGDNNNNKEVGKCNKIKENEIQEENVEKKKKRFSPNWKYASSVQKNYRRRGGGLLLCQKLGDGLGQNWMAFSSFYGLDITECWWFLCISIFLYMYIRLYMGIWSTTDGFRLHFHPGNNIEKKKKKGIVFFDRNLNLKRLKDKSGIDNGTRWHQCLNKRPSSFIIPYFFFCLILILFYFFKIISNIPMYLQIVFVWSRFPRFPGEPMEVWNK